MSILIGYGKTKDKNGKTYISGFFTEEFLKLQPQFKGLLPILKYIPTENRKSDKSPHWALELFTPEETPAEAEPKIPQEETKALQNNINTALIKEETIIPFDNFSS